MFVPYWLDTVCDDCGGGDLTGDGNVNLDDFAELAKHWLQTESE